MCGLWFQNLAGDRRPNIFKGGGGSASAGGIIPRGSFEIGGKAPHLRPQSKLAKIAARPAAVGWPRRLTSLFCLSSDRHEPTRPHRRRRRSISLNRPSPWRASKQGLIPCSTTQRSTTGRSSGLEGEPEWGGGLLALVCIGKIRKLIRVCASASASASASVSIVFSSMRHLLSTRLLN